mgnify:CR=1 FL=1
MTLPLMRWLIFDATSYARGWCHDKSAKIIVGNIGTNKDTQLKDKWLYSIKADNNRVFHHYSTLVKQRKISRGEYEYYQEKIKINEEMGGLFIPQPSELPTNIILQQFRQKCSWLCGS